MENVSTAHTNIMLFFPPYTYTGKTSPYAAVSLGPRSSSYSSVVFLLG
jgi:hypothetical protein